MKSAIVFLMALTVFTTLFLETSAAAVDPTTSEGSINVDITVIRFLDGAMKFSEGIIANSIQNTVNALVTAEGGDRDSLTQAKIWFTDLLGLCIKLHYEMIDVLIDGSRKPIETVTDNIGDAIVIKRAEWSVLSGNLENLPDPREDLDEKMRVNFANADVIEIRLRELLSARK